MGGDGAADNEKPIHRVWVNSFMIGKFPVTNREYRVFVEENTAPEPHFWSDQMFSQPDQPVVGTSWYEAVAYCRWLSKRTGKQLRLPTEAEWEYSARGGLEGRLYPWGDEHPSERPFPGYDLRTGGPERIGRYEPNGFGIYDMAEGVHEWCSDFYDPSYYNRSPKSNPQGPAMGERRVSRGGSWRHRIKFSRCAARSSINPSYQYSDYGFRLAGQL